jgi:transposase
MHKDYGTWFYQVDEFLKLLAQGYDREAIMKAMSISCSTFYNWKNKHTSL